ncbi:MAG: hypothetical protein ACXV5P_09010, partial [Halobacteriota archaeon]
GLRWISCSHQRHAYCEARVAPRLDRLCWVIPRSVLRSKGVRQEYAFKTGSTWNAHGCAAAVRDMAVK